MTDPYIPTTDEMRVRASTFWIDDKTYEVDKQRAHEFDRWLFTLQASLFAQGKDCGEDYYTQAEQARIIRLLDDELIKCDCKDPLRHVAKKIRGEKA